MDWMDVQALEARAGDPLQAAGASAALLEGLNPEQRAAVTHAEGPLLILAGPGSGKTRVITRRIAWLCSQGQARPWELLAITFTNKAAREMRERVERLLPAKGLWISTFHALGARILRREIEVLAQGWTRDFTIYDTHDRNQLLRRILSESNYDAARFKPAAVGAWISARKNRAGAAPPDADDGIEAEALAKLARAYDEALAKNNALDFDDLLLKLLELFERHPGVRDAYSSRFRFVMVDEYQDTNRVQYEITRHLSGWHKNLAVCGDPDQSIYAWRGADIRNILDFEQDFGAPRVVKLEQNYRSTRNILEAAQALIAHNRARKQKSTISASGEAGEKLCILECGSEDDEARELVQQIAALRARGTPLREVAIFYRANFLQRALEAALRRASVPYRIVAGVEFYERREIRDLLAWLKLAVNPSDDVAFLRVVNVPARGIGEKSLAELASLAADRRIPLSQALRSSELGSRIRGRARAGLEAFAVLLVRLQALAERPAAVAIDELLAAIDTESWLSEMEDETLVDRQANVDELRAHAEHWDQGPEAPGVPRNLRGFLQEVALVSETDQPESENERVTLMTLHAAKGLEFDAVFVAGCEEELLPHSRALSETRGGDPDAGLEEERRLCYVGMTRARKRLFLSWARERMQFGSFSLRRPSRFLEEIPQALVEGALGAGTDEDPFLAEDALPAEPEFKAGDRVEHAHFGRGTVLRVQGTGVNARASVRFPEHGERQLLLFYAKLQLLGRAGA
jgi:DNA helicase-2/ATP-dependent DNA helicase PcrA